MELLKDKFYVVECRSTDEEHSEPFGTLEEAIKKARFEWGRFTRQEKNKYKIEVRKYDNPEENMDGDLYDWGYKIRDREAGNIIEYLLDIHDVQNTLEDYIKEDAEDDLSASEQELLDFYEVIDLATGERMTIEWWECNQEVNVY